MNWPQKRRMRYSCKIDKYTAVPEELVVAKKAIYFTAFRTLCGSRTRLKKPDEENDMTAAKIERPDELENQQHVTASVICNSMRGNDIQPQFALNSVNPKRHASVAQFSKEVTLPIDSYSPISFALRKKLLGQCLMVTPLFHPHKDVEGIKNGSRQSLEVPVNDGLERQRKGSAEATVKEAKKKFDEEEKEISVQDFDFEVGEMTSVERFEKTRRWSSEGYEMVAEQVKKRSSISLEDITLEERRKSSGTNGEGNESEMRRKSSQESEEIASTETKLSEIDENRDSSTDSEADVEKIRRQSTQLLEISIEESRRKSSKEPDEITEEEISHTSIEKTEEMTLEQTERKISHISDKQENDSRRRSSANPDFTEEESKDSGGSETKRKSYVKCIDENGENELLAVAEKAIHKLIAPYGIGKLQTWIDRRPRGIKVVPCKKEHPFGYDTKDTRQRRWSPLLNGPPLMDNGWMGNTIVPTYTTTHRDTYQAEKCPRNKCVHTPAVVHLGYGYLDALEKCYLTSYKDMFRHPESYH